MENGFITIMNEKIPFEDVEEARKYLSDIKADIALDLEILPDDIVLTLANANWASGLRPGDINDVEV